MTPYKIAVKLFAAPPIPPLASFIPIFHEWIREQTAGGPATLPGHLLIDVADYAHVENGPGIVLVSSEANLYIDETAGRPGLLYVRKTPGVGTFSDRLRSAVESTLHAAERLQSAVALQGRLKFKTDEVQIRLNDRLLTPNNSQTLADHSPAFDSLAQSLFPNQPVQIRSTGLPRDLFTLNIQAPIGPQLATMISSLATMAV